MNTKASRERVEILFVIPPKFAGLSSAISQKRMSDPAREGVAHFEYNQQHQRHVVIPSVIKRFDLKIIDNAINNITYITLMIVVNSYCLSIKIKIK